jgi:menaquinone reductase, multiheme cytochrome c subunit
MTGSIFPEWLDRMKPLVGCGLVVGLVYVVAMLYYGGSPEAWRVGYSPKQPVAFSHALHAGELGMDCRYCHTTVENAAFAAIPPSATCMNCHTQIAPQSRQLLALRENHAVEASVPWVRIHNLPDYVYFDHSAHVSRGVSCVSCHDRVDQMEQVYLAKPLSMSWCLDCHRDPDPHLRPPEFVTDLDWVPEDDVLQVGRRVREQLHINPSISCSTCHR